MIKRGKYTQKTFQPFKIYKNMQKCYEIILLRITWNEKVATKYAVEVISEKYAES